MGKPGFIYALSDSTGIRYIGQSGNPSRRYTQHVSQWQNKGKTKRNIWLSDLIVADTLPTMTILEKTDDMDEAETRLIKQYRAEGYDLVNTADGGQTMSYLRRRKDGQPWGKRWSPVQRVLIGMKENVAIQKRWGGNVLAAELVLAQTQLLIDAYGKDKMNHELWRRRGERLYN